MKHSKKGFTLVELLVVIAILAILATVSVVGYTSFIAKANLSNDQTTIAMMNRNLQAAAIGTELNTAADAMEAIRVYGVVGDKLSPYSKNYHYAYDNASKQFVLLDENDTIVYPEKAVGSDDLWVFFRGSSDDIVADAKGYVLTRSLTSDDVKVLNEHFAGKTIDLGGFVCGQSKDELNVELVKNSGIVTDASWGFSTSEGFVEDAEGKYTLSTYTYNNNNGFPVRNITVQSGTYENVTFNGALRFSGENFSATFKNCVIVSENTNCILPSYSNTSYNTITFIDCTFITLRSDGETENFQVTDRDYPAGTVLKFQGCEFNTQRGIAIGGDYTVEVIDCQFNLPMGSDDNYAFRWLSYNVEQFTVKNCSFNSCQSIMQVRVTDASLNAPTSVTFSGNTFNTIGGEKVVQHTTNTNTTIYNFFKNLI